MRAWGGEGDPRWPLFLFEWFGKVGGGAGIEMWSLEREEMWLGQSRACWLWGAHGHQGHI